MSPLKLQVFTDNNEDAENSIYNAVRLMVPYIRPYHEYKFKILFSTQKCVNI